jgi:glycosyltransferase involved in cell wall biosynthesis
MAAALAGRPFTLTAHANDIWQADNALHLERRLSRARALVTVTEYNARHLRSLAPGTPVHVVRCAVEPAPPAPAPADGPILCVGRFVPKKAIDLLIKAMPLLPAGSHLELIGEGPMEGELRELARALAVQDRVDFLGPQPPEEVVAGYERCSVFCLPCRIASDGDRDGMPVVLLEALARALPVVTTFSFEPELVQDGVTARVVGSESSESLAAGIVELLRDRRLAGELGACGRRTIREQAAPDAATEALRRIFG